MDAHTQKLRDLVERECVSSLMNDTKWMEAIALFKSLGVQCRIKLLTGQESTDWSTLWASALAPYVETSGLTPVQVLEIEWMEVEPFRRIYRGHLLRDKTVDYTEEIEQRLRSFGVPYVWHD